jgi:hypothetical protein
VNEVDLPVDFDEGAAVERETKTHQGSDPLSFRRTMICEGVNSTSDMKHYASDTGHEYCSKSLFIMCGLYCPFNTVSINLGHPF